MTNSGSLIAVFPTALPPMEDETSASAIKTVRFSRKSTSIQISYRTQEKALGWYSKEDQSLFRRQRKHDVHKCLAMLMQDCYDEDILIQCVGIDQFLSEDIPQRCREIHQARLDHKNLVLNAQGGIRRPEDLARISMHSSRVDKERAHKVACIVGAL